MPLDIRQRQIQQSALLYSIVFLGGMTILKLVPSLLTLVKRRSSSVAAASAPLARHPLGSDALRIEEQILSTQKPAELMGIQVKQCTSNSLTLQAPLDERHLNVHGTAFAGSMYSVASLTSYYLVWIHLTKWQEKIKSKDDALYTLVAKSGTIRYHRPVKDPSKWIVAKSQFDSRGGRGSPTIFLLQLTRSGTAYWTVSGKILENDNDPSSVACEYDIELCAKKTKPKD